MQAANGLPAKDAWAQCGHPNGEAGIQNIRKRARELKARRLLGLVPAATDGALVGRAAAFNRPSPAPAAAASPVLVLAVEVVGAEPASSKRKQPAFRLRPDQVQKAALAKKVAGDAFNKAYAAATA